MQDAPWLQEALALPLANRHQARRESPRTSWADLDDDDRDDDLNSQAPSQDFSSDNGGHPAGDIKVPGRKPKGTKLGNKALSKLEAASPIHSKSGTGPSTDESSMDASSVSEDMSATPRSAMGSTRSTQSASDSGDGTNSYQNAGYSIGSAKHDEDGCKPCLFVHTHVGCQNGSNCEFCHFIHKRKNKARPCKGKRERYRKLLLRMEEDALEGGSAIDNLSDAGSGSASYASHDEICTTVQS